jgi:putative hemolysin
MEHVMRALVLLLALAACEAPIPEVTEEQIAYRLNDPARSGADNIAVIGAEALCDTPEQAVTERQGIGNVTYCVRSGGDTPAAPAN